MKMFAPLGFVRGLTEEQIAAIADPRKRARRNSRRCAKRSNAADCLAGPPERIRDRLLELQERYPGLRQVHVGPGGRHAEARHPGAARRLCARGHADVQESAGDCRLMLRTNPLKTALAAGQVQLGTWINLVRNPAVLVLLKSAGLDYARVDMEHSSPSIETVADMAVLARALEFPLVVRPPEGNREWITRLLDVGVWGLHVPQVDNPEIAANVAQAARYAPLGDRGMAGFRRVPIIRWTRRHANDWTS